MLKNNAPFLILILLIIISFSFSCRRKTIEIVITPEALKNHLQRARYFGNVKKVETDTYYYSNRDSNYFLSNKNIQLYSSDGYLTQVILLDKNNDTVSKRILYYLPNANENYWLEYNYRDFNVTKDTFIYDKNGFKSEEYFWLNDSLLYKIQYKTDAIGGIIEMKRLLPEYMLTNKVYYNDYGLMERIEEYDPDNKLFKFITIEYDNYGDEVNRRAYKASNEMIEYTYTQYNNDGLIQKIIFEDRLHHMREDRIYTQHDKTKNWLEEITMQGKDTVRKRVREIRYY
ncbi:MAG: hypothetical protein FWF70_01180 [Bacteroidetes bacterium]|nr:hypothetical protein [Bacteroidota bacterium]MCL1969423.1 hypothetical protein [Bacteroidota bacterium]MCL1969696.1 hypothetical protein [Bacteroidota bacterium]